MANSSDDDDDVRKNSDKEQCQNNKLKPFVSDISNHKAVDLAIRECVPVEQLDILSICLLRAMISKNTTISDFVETVNNLYLMVKANTI